MIHSVQETSSPSEGENTLPLEMILPNTLRVLIAFLLLGLYCFPTVAQDESGHLLVPGDMVRIMVFHNPDLQLDARVSDKGTLFYPLSGTVEVAGLAAAAVEQKLARLMRQGGIDIDPKQVSVALLKTPVGQTAAGTVGDKGDYRLGPGDAIRVAVFQNPDLSLEARVSDSGTITYPLIGLVNLGGLTVVGAEHKLAKMLRDGGFVVDPQLSITLLQVRGSQVSLLGLVNRPGRYPLEQANMKMTDVLALGGGVVQGAAESIVLVGMRDGKWMRKVIDVASMIMSGNPGDDFRIQGGDILYVNKAPVFYVSGEVQRPGSYRLERDMTLMQALATGGGITPRGTERDIRVFRRDEKTGKTERVEIEMQDPVRPDDVINVRESWF